MATVSEDKFHQPGWRIEQKYRQGVLIGNWSEERYDFEKQKYTLNSTQRADYASPNAPKPEADTRRRMMLMNEGLQKDILFSHHGKRYMNNSITLYDQEFNHRRRHTTPRSWDWHRLAWIPEVSDHPILGEGTKWGLHKSLKEKWSKEEKLSNIGDFNSTYFLSYSHLPRSSLNTSRYSSPRKLSSHFHSNNVNKDLLLREEPHTTSVKPEFEQSGLSSPTNTPSDPLTDLNKSSL